MGKIEYYFIELSINDISPHPNNDFSMNHEEIEQLAESIERDGLGQLPLVRPFQGKHQMIAGHKRLEAFKRLAEKDNAYAMIPVNSADIDDKTAEILIVVTNLLSRELSQEERGKYLTRLNPFVTEMRKEQPEITKGIPTADLISTIIKEKTGRDISPSTIKRAQRAAKAEEEAKKKKGVYESKLTKNWKVEVSTDRYDPQTVKALSELPEKAQNELFIKMQRQNLSVAEVRKATKTAVPLSKEETSKTMRSILAAMKTLDEAKTNNSQFDIVLMSDISERWSKLYSAVLKNKGNRL